MTDQSSKLIQFSIKTFNDILTQTKSIKKKLNPFLTRFQQYDMELIYQTMAYLHQCMTKPKSQLKYKFNSLFVLKILFDTSNYILINWIQVFFLPHILQIAKFNLTGQNNGKDYFIQQGYTAADDPQIEKFGFNYTLLASQLIQIAALVKPYRLFQFQFLQSKSDFVIALEQLKKQGFKIPDKLSIYAKPEVVQGQVAKYTQNLHQIDQSNEQFTQIYSQFSSAKLEQYLIRDHTNDKNYDINIVQLYQSGDLYVSSAAIQICKAQLRQHRSIVSLQNAIYVLHRIMLSADYEAFYVLNYQDTLNKLIIQVFQCDKAERGVKRGQKFFTKFKQPNQSKKLYLTFIDYLQKWAMLSGNFFNEDENIIKKIITCLIQTLKIELPQPINLEAQAKLFKACALKNKERNNRLAQQIQKSPSALKSVLQKSKQSIPKIPSTSQIKSSVPESIISNSKIDSSKNMSTPLPPPSNSHKQIPFVINMNLVQSIHNKYLNDKQNYDKNKSILNQFVQTLDDELGKVPDQVFDQIYEKAVSLQKQVQIILKQGQAQRSIKKAPQIKPQPIKLQTKKIQSNSQILSKKVQSQTIIQYQHTNEHKSLPRNEPIKQSKKANQSFEDTPVKNFGIEDSQRNQQQQNIEQLGYKENKASTKHIPEVKLINSQQSLKIGYENQNRVSDSHKDIPAPTIKLGYEQPVKQRQQYEHPSNLGYKKEVEEKQNITQLGHEQQSSMKNTSQRVIRKTEDLSSSRKRIAESSIQSNSKVQHFTPQSSQFSIREGFQYDKSNFKKKQYHADDELQILLEQFEENIYINKPKQFKSLSGQLRQSKNKITSQQVSPQRQASQHNLSQHIMISNQSQPVLGFSSQHSHAPVTISPKKIPNYELEQQLVEQLVLEQDEINPPQLNPLSESFHDIEQLEQRLKSNSLPNGLSFKNCFQGDKYILQLQEDKKTKMYWLENDTTNLVKNILVKKQKSKQSKINVPEILYQRNKKYQLELKSVEQQKNRKIKQLESKVKNLQKQSEFYKDQVALHAEEIKTLKVQSQYDKQSVGQQKGYLQDLQNIAAQKFNSPTRFGYSGLKNMQFDTSNIKQTMYLDPKGKLINSKNYKQYFEQFKKEKQKKMILKNKDLLYKDKDVEIGFMTKKQNDKLIVTLYITPEKDMESLSWKIHSDDALHIESEPNCFIGYIRTRKQEKIFLTVQVNRPCFVLPQISFTYTVSEQSQSAKIVLPCSFHKFFYIKECDIDLNEYFKKNDKIIRGEQVPYSKRILKNLDNLKQYFQSMYVLNKGLPNQQGQISYGGLAVYKQYQFPIRISIKPNQFLYVQGGISQLDEQGKNEISIIEYYISTVTYLLMKQIQ